jgi:hypothetical protein
MPEPIFMKLGIYIMGLEPISRENVKKKKKRQIYPCNRLCRRIGL